MDDPPLLAAGRSADVFDLGDGRVLRRLRRGRVPDHEPVAMEHARRHGYPVPAVHLVDGTDMVLERVDGANWLQQLERRPWRARRVGRELGRLHRRLASVPVEGVELRTVIEPGEVVFHGDLHPLNVLVAPNGPVVIDWEGAGLAPRGADAAVTWLLLSVAEVDDVAPVIRPFVSIVRRALLAGFLAEVDRPRREVVGAVCELRLRDANLRPTELDRIRRFRAEHG